MTGLTGKLVTTMNYEVGTFGMLFGVTNGVVNLAVNGKVGTGAIELWLMIVDGKLEVAMITALVPGINTIYVSGTLVGTEVYGTITGDVGIVLTTMYYEVGTFGMLFGVTNGVVNLMVYGVVGNE
jgi:hypothetical protein